jgi:general secretion pathway protein G
MSIVALLTLIVCSASVHARPLADRVPADAIIYVGWTGIENKGPGYAGSHLEALCKAGEFEKLINQTLPQLIDKAAQQNAEFAEAARIALPVLKPLVKHPTAIWIGSPILVENEKPVFRVGLHCDAGPDAAAMHDQLAELLKAAPRDVQRELNPKVSRTDNVVTVTLNYADNELPAAGAGLSASPEFKSLQAHLVPNTAFIAYVNIERLTVVADHAVNLYAKDQQPAQLWPKVRDAIGLPSVKRFVWSSGFDGKDWADHVFLHAPEPRSGLVALADPTPLSDDALRAIPASATMAGASRFDVSKLIDGLKKAAVAIEPGAEGEIDRIFKDASQKIGMDLEKDLIDAFGPEWVFYADPMTGGRGMLGSVVLNKLRDPAKAEQALKKLQDLIAAEVAKAAQNQPIKLRFLTTESNGTTIHYVGTPIISPAWAVKNGYLVAALFPQMVAGAVDQIGANKPSILDNPDYQDLRKRLGVAKANEVMFLDLQKTAPDAYASHVAVSRLTGFADLLGVDAPAMLLPPLGRLMPHLTPAGSVTWTDAEGIHVKALSPFPGATMLASDPFSNLFGLLPALGAVSQGAAVNRVEAARDAHAAADLANIRHAVNAYELVYGRFPSAEEGLAVLVDPPTVEGRPGSPFIQREQLVDAWGRPYQYLPPVQGKAYAVFSSGPDGLAGTADDIRR